MGEGVSGAAKPFIGKRYGHVLWGEGGSKGLVQSSFCKKVCFWVPEELLCVKIIYSLHASTHELQYHIPTQAISEKYHFLIYQIDFVISNFLCQNVQTAQPYFVFLGSVLWMILKV